QQRLVARPDILAFNACISKKSLSLEPAVPPVLTSSSSQEETSSRFNSKHKANASPAAIRTARSSASKRVDRNAMGHAAPRTEMPMAEKVLEEAVGHKPRSVASPSPSHAS
ncbi:hypothetical protein ACJX0J_041653, partial [Zea mays]